MISKSKLKIFLNFPPMAKISYILPIIQKKIIQRNLPKEIVTIQDKIKHEIHKL